MTTPVATRGSREPWIKVKVGLVRSDKLGALPSDTARWGWMKVLAEAKLQRRMGLFASVKAIADLIGRHGRFVPEYISAGLLHVAPALCDRCLVQYGDAHPSEVMVHDYRIEQRDPTNADRQADWRNGSVTPAVTEPVTLKVTPVSRAQGMTVTVTETEREENVGRKASLSPQAQPMPRVAQSRPILLTRDQLESWDSFQAWQWEPFKEAWFARGFRFPPAGSPDDDDTSQRGLLWQIAEGNPHRLGDWVRQAEGRTAREVIDSVLTQWHELRAEVIGDEQEETEARTVRRTEGPTKLGVVLGRVMAARE